jgi:hypothetical protein
MIAREIPCDGKGYAHLIGIPYTIGITLEWGILLGNYDFSQIVA